MSSRSIAVSVRGLSKSYTIGNNVESHGTLAESLVHRLKHPFARPSRETFWALKDVEFDVAKGDVVGIIGRNGAGKSTLLKILSQITEPSAGEVRLYGRVGSLLEVGTGFHPELTGRENIYLNGAILGMSRHEVKRQFDAIVEFAEVGTFLDTPVKRYSSGMYVRLAFAVAAHLNPEILIVDEVLAVGDAQFQKKCLGKLGDVSRHGGKTVLFVSHNMGAIAELCRSCILLKGGSIAQTGQTSQVVEAYLGEAGRAGTDVVLPFAGNLHAAAVFTRCWITNMEGIGVTTVDVRRAFLIGLEVLARRDVADTEITLRVENSLGQPIFSSSYSQLRGSRAYLAGGRHVFFVEVPGSFLMPNSYSLNIALHRPNIEVIDIHENVMVFSVEETGSDLWEYRGQNAGCVLTRLPWTHSRDEIDLNRSINIVETVV